MTKTRILAEVQEDQIVTTTVTQRKKNNLPPFHGIGGCMDYNTKIKGIDNLHGILKNLSVTATWFWWSLIEIRNFKTNECVFKAKDIAESKKITKAYKELSNLDLIKRLSKQHYIINPKAYLPDFNRYEDVAIKWNSK